MPCVALFAFLPTVSSQTTGAVLMDDDMTDGFADPCPPGSTAPTGGSASAPGRTAHPACRPPWSNGWETVEEGFTTFHARVEPSGPLLLLRGVGGVAPGAARTVVQHVALTSRSPSLALTIGSRTYTLLGRPAQGPVEADTSEHKQSDLYQPGEGYPEARDTSTDRVDQVEGHHHGEDQQFGDGANRHRSNRREVVEPQ